MAAEADYKIGETIVYRTSITDTERIVVVTERFTGACEGQERAGFDGLEVGTNKSVWGYDDQIIGVGK